MTTFMDVGEVKNMEGDDEDEEEDVKRVLAVVALHGAPFPFPQKMNIPDLSHYFGSIAWCRRSNVVACATETCARFVMSNSDQQPAFWIPVHVFDPERPTEHTVFNVTAESPSDSIQFLEWSPSTCEQALLVGNTSGRITIWSHPTRGPSNVARAVNSWMCEYEWRQEPAVVTKWVIGPTPYRFSSTPSVGQPSTKSLEERFLAHGPRSSVRWPSLLCIASIFYSGSVQLHWRKWPLGQMDSPPKWFSTNKAVLGAGPSGLFAADTIVTKTGSLVVAGTPVGTPSTVIVWEVSPWVTNASAGNQPPPKYGLPAQAPRAFGPPAWPGIAALAAYLISWQQQPGVESTSGTSHADSDAKDAGPLLHCSPISNLSAYVAPDANMLTTWGSGIVDIAFDPSLGGSALVTVLCEGYFVSPENPENGPALTGWRYQRWESSTQPVAIHPIFEAGGGNFPSPSPLGTVTIWTAVSNNFISPKGVSKSGGSLMQADIRMRLNIMQRPVNPRCISKIVFSSTGAEFALSLVSGEVYVFPVFSATPIESFTVHSVLNMAPAVAFSPTGCCLASVWHSKKTDRSQVKVICLEPPGLAANNQGGIGTASSWERHLADRFWWSLVADLDWWDIVACAFIAVQDGAATIARVTAVLDTDFHALPNHLHRQSCSNALDRLKCRMLEGYDSADNRALVLDMQARLLLDLMGKGIEAALINPTGIVVEPWTASTESLQGLGHETMAVDPALVPTIQAYVDTILDLASHFLTRLRRYASFCRTLASHAVTNSSSMSNSRPGVNLSNGNTRSSQPGQGSAPQTDSVNHNSGTASVQAWVQGAIAKINSTAEGAASNAPSTGLAPSASLPLTVSTATFPGIPAVRLIGDRVFLHRLCQLLFFCLVFRKRQLPRYLPVPSRLAADATSVGNKAAAGGGVVAKSEDANGTSTTARPTTSGVSNVKMEDGARTASVNKAEDGPLPRSARIGHGNGGQGYTPDEVKVLFLVIVDLCKKTHLHTHPVPKSEAGVNNPMPRLHFVDGQYQVQPEIIETSLGPHMQQLPRPRGADAAGLLMRELELHPPSEDWNRRSLAFGPWSNTLQRDLKSFEEEDQEAHEFAHELWPRKRRYAERDVALGMKSAIGLGSFSGFMGSRRDVITGIWKTSHHAVWHRCLRCGRQTASLASPTLAAPGSAAPTSTRESWWTGRWVNGCPACGGRWVRFHL